MNVDEFVDTEVSKEFEKNKQVKPIPDEYAGATPYLYVNMAEAALDFYQKAFDAEIVVSVKDDKKRIMHAEVKIGKARIMLSDEFPEMDCYSPRHLGGTTCGLYLYFDDVDKVFAKAIAAGAKELNKVEDHYYGDRGGKLLDPFGHHWFICTRKENLSYEEMKKRTEEQMHKGPVH